MSSLVRRQNIRAMQKQGFVRTDYVLVKDEASGGVRQRKVRRGGLILNSDNEPVGYNWPRYVPPPELTRAVKVEPKTPRGHRRGKPSSWRSGREAA